MALELYESVSHLISPMDVISFYGAEEEWWNPSELLSRIISDATKGGPSHVAPVLYGISPNNPKVSICQSTLSKKVNGVVNTILEDELLSYPKGSTAYWHQRLNPPTPIELETFYKSCTACTNTSHYSVAELFGFLLGKKVEDIIGLHFGAVCSV